MINLHINTHLAQTIGVEMGCPEVTRPKSFEEAMCCNDSSWLQKVHPPFHRGVCHKKFEVATIRVYASCFCFFWTMCVCGVWMFCMFIDASTQISTCGCSIFPFHRAFLGLLLFPKENPMETHLPSWSVLKWPFLTSRSWSMMHDQFQWIICLSAIQTKRWLNICETWGIIVSSMTLVLNC